MARQSKQEIYIKILVDSREKDLSWLDKFKFDKKISNEKIQIIGYELREPFKALSNQGKKIPTSTGDVGISYSFDQDTWYDTTLSIELKKGEDFTTTLYSNWTRFKKEIERAKEYGLDFYLVYNQSTSKMYEHFDKLKTLRRIPYSVQAHKVVYDRMLELMDNNIPLFYTHEIHEVVKRIIKHYVKKHKLQYPTK